MDPPARTAAASDTFAALLSVPIIPSRFFILMQAEIALIKTSTRDLIERYKQ